MSTTGEVAHVHHVIDYIEIAVSDIEAAKFPGGRRFHFADPAGNELAISSDRSTTGP